MTVLNYRLVENVAGHHAFLSELKDFCEDYGWTVVRHLTNVQWKTTSPQSFIAGTESFLEITSVGYGGQTLHFRFRMQNAGTDAQAEWLEKRGHLGNTTLQAVSTHPVDQTGAWDTSGNKYLSIPTGTIPAVWFFGNSKFIFVVIKCDSTYCNFLSFGSLELIYGTGETEAQWSGYSNTTQTNRKWYDKNDECPLDKAGSNIYYNGTNKNSSDSGWDFMFTTGNGITNGKFGTYANMVVKNEYSDVRPLWKQMMWMKDTVDGLWFPLGFSPVYRIWHEGLQIGEKVTYGEDEYLTFPMCRLNERQYGIAIQIAEAA